MWKNLLPSAQPPIRPSNRSGYQAIKDRIQQVKFRKNFEKKTEILWNFVALLKLKKNIHCFDVTTRASTVYVQPRYNLIDTVIDSSRFFVFLFFGRVLLGPGNSVAKDGGSGARSRVYIAATVFCQSGVLLSPPPHTYLPKCCVNLT